MNCGSGVREGAKGLGLLKANIHTLKAETPKKHITECLQERPDLKILVLFDEADNFLDADAESRARSQSCRNSRSSCPTPTDGSKLCFGLQNVQRFQGIPNQPGPV